MPAWLLILILMEVVIVAINPATKDYTWYQKLRRPHWLRFFIWIPLVWLVITASLYFSALISWETTNSWLLILSYLLLLILLEGHTWLLCRFRSLRLGSVTLGLGWLFSLVLAIGLALQSNLGTASLLLLPLLIWAPIETYALETMRRINR